jgi:hypothetical protein
LRALIRESVSVIPSLLWDSRVIFKLFQFLETRQSPKPFALLWDSERQYDT